MISSIDDRSLVWKDFHMNDMSHADLIPIVTDFQDPAKCAEFLAAAQRDCELPLPIGPVPPGPWHGQPVDADLIAALDAVIAGLPQPPAR